MKNQTNTTVNRMNAPFSNKLTKSLLLGLGLGAMATLSACSDSSQTDTDQASQTEQVSKSVESSPAQQNAMDVKQPAPEASEKQPLASLPEAAKEVQPEKPQLPEITPKAAIEEKTEITEKAVEEKVEELKASAQERLAVEENTISGASVFASCASCHGAQAEGGIGPKLTGQSPDEIVDKLKRYKAGEQIGPLTGMMAPMAAPLSEGEMKAVAEYVSAL